MKKIRVLLVDDHTIFREGMRALLADEEDILVCGEAGTGHEALRLANELHPDVIVMDIAMPDLNGLQATSMIKRVNPDVEVIVLSMYDDESFVTQAVQAGVRGYLLKQTAASDLLLAIREVMKGNAHFSPTISKVLLENQSLATGDKDLNLREREVLQLIAEGKTNKEICSILAVGMKTVEKYRQDIMNKLDIHDVAGLTRYAMKRGIVK